jgi:hypothetical protein
MTTLPKLLREKRFLISAEDEAELIADDTQGAKSAFRLRRR